MPIGSRRPQQDTDDTATVDSETAVLQGTRNRNVKRPNSLEQDLRSQGMGFSPVVSEAVRRATPGRTIDAIEEGGGDYDNQPTRARIFDLRRISIIGVTLVFIISIAIMSSRGFAKPPPSFSTSTATPPHPTEDGLPHLHKYAYVFVAYDKFGYSVAHQLYDQLEKSMEEQAHKEHPGHGHLKEQFINPRSQFNTETNCTEMNLESSTVTILESPEFHCNIQKLRSLFMDHKDLKQEKWGVKLIHLVRNPFTMAIANYQDRKSNNMPEEVRFKNPCSSLSQDFTVSGADLNSPILSENGIMNHEDFDNILARCNEMFQTKPGLESASYQQHLENLPVRDGLKLSVADGVNSIALMASDLIAFKKVHALVQEEASNPDRKRLRHLDMLTMPLDEVLNYPGNSMMDFMDFIFGNYVPFNFKHKAAAEYEHNQIKEDSMDATDVDELIGFLKHDPIYGPPLTRVESLLDSVLSEQ